MHPYIHAQKNPDKPAYIMAGSGETVTYRQLDDQSNRIAQLFRSLGLKAGDHIALFLENHPRYFENNGTKNGYCVAVVGPKLAKFRKGYAARLKSR